MSTSPRGPAIWIGASISSLAGLLVWLGVAGAAGPAPVSRLVIALLAAHLPYAVALIVIRRWRGRSLSPWLVLGFAAALRLILVPFPPVLSDDVHRYVWDGRVTGAGINPYRYSPTASELADLRDDLWSRINHPELRTPYPPAAQGVFALVAGCSPTVEAFKLTSALADVGVVALVILLAGGRFRRRKREEAARREPTETRATLAGAVYGLNPLACVETGLSGHLEPIGVGVALLSLLALVRRRALLGAALAAMGCGIKIAPLLLWPIAAVRDRRAWLLFPVLVVALYLPFASAGLGTVETLDSYARRWEDNAGLFSVVKGGAMLVIGALSGAGDEQEMVHVPLLDRPAERLQGTFLSLHKDGPIDPRRPGSFTLGDLSLAVAKLILGGTMLLVIIAVLRRGLAPLPAAGWVLGALLVVTPVLHPWYLLWILPLAAVLGLWPWYVLASLVPLSYLALDGWWARQIWQLPSWVAPLEYGLFAAAMIAWFRFRGQK